MEEKKSLIVFQDKKIRRTWHNDEWWFSVVDIVNVLMENGDGRNYWKVTKFRLKEEGSEVVTFCNQFKLIAGDGKMRETDCANTEGIFRIIQSISSPKAEPLKLWLAKVGYERVQEIENPELVQNRAREYYEMKGYPKDWIEKRLRGIVIRQDLTEEWKQRNIEQNYEFGILTDEITKATFGKNVKEYKEFKDLNKENLRDYMGDWELILTMIGEKATTDITKAKDSKGFNECKESAQKGGKIANNTRLELEKETGKSVVSKDNFLSINKKKLDKKK